jgi:hypothetical protein
MALEELNADNSRYCDKAGRKDVVRYSVMILLMVALRTEGALAIQ